MHIYVYINTCAFFPFVSPALSLSLYIYIYIYIYIERERERERVSELVRVRG